MKPYDNDEDTAPVLWISDGPAPLGLWEKLHHEHPASGLWPLLLAPLSTTDVEFRPWGSGELQPRYAIEPDWYDPAALLRTNWEYYATPDADAPSTRTRAPNSPLVQVGFAELELSVGAPPQDHEPALRIAAEHLAFCPDDIFQGVGTIADYAPGLVNADRWSFWRD
ncbi:DUF4253 domain-containing protein [Kitasatospora sp. NPDC051984]|uniref:DUF4253 domain-containing protein n=1 Tax=Kitasatospora sp. NPDC051984 TaxID=3364059 RepID=UPI0037C8B195